MNTKLSKTLPIMILLTLLSVTACSGRAASAGVSTPTPQTSAALPKLSPTSMPITTAAPAPVETSNAQSTMQVTLADNESTLTLTAGQSLLLNLGAEYDWNVTVDDQKVLSREIGITVIKGAQGVYQALEAGRTNLSATGQPVCLQSNPACKETARTFHILVVVSPAPSAISTEEPIQP